MRTSAYSASAVKPPPSATVTRCWTSTSSGCCGTWRGSICPACTAARAAAASISSRLCVGTRLMREGRPGAWPLRPARWIKRATPLAEPICSTRSTGKKSTPRSRLEVHTAARTVPFFSPASTHSRTALSSEPWCSAITPAQSGRASRIAWYQRSAWARVLVNTRVEALSSIAWTTWASMLKPMWPAQAKRSARAGSKVSMTSFLAVAPCTVTASSAAVPTSADSASGRLPRVADTPQLSSAGLNWRSRASASCSCTPRLLPSNSCHSSTTASFTCCSTSRASARASRSVRLSGVVTSTVGSRLACALRSALLLSPLRRALVQAGAKSASGSRRASSVSAANARIGVIQSTVSGGAALPATPDLAKACKAPSQMAKVLPEPVLECSKPLRPAFIVRQTSRWKANGFQPRTASQAAGVMAARRAATTARRPPPPACPRASAASAESAGRRRSCGAGCGRCPRSPARKRASA